MTNKHINAISLLISAIAYITIGFFIVFWSDESITILRLALAAFFIGHGFLSFFRLFTNHAKTNIIVAVLAASSNFLVALGLYLFPYWIHGAISVIFGLWMLINSIVRMIVYWQYRQNKIKSRFLTFWGSIGSLVCAIVLFANPGFYSGIISDIIGVYTIFYGSTIFGDFIREAIPKSTTNKMKRRLRFSLPTVIAAFIPRFFVKSYNKLMANETDETVRNEWLSEMKKNDDEPEMEVFVHGGADGTTQFGHLDIFFEGKVYSYGSYDEASQRLWAAVGDGVLFTLEDKEEYLKFCIANNHKTIVSFGVNVTTKQVQAVRNEISQIFLDVEPWRCDAEIAQEKGDDFSSFDDYASKLYRATHATFYKFCRGRFKSYFVMGANCVMLADKIIGSSGSDVLSINGIITPGAYYNYLNTEFLRPMGMVVTRTVYSAESFGLESTKKHYKEDHRGSEKN